MLASAANAAGRVESANIVFETVYKSSLGNVRGQLGVGELVSCSVSLPPGATATWEVEGAQASLNRTSGPRVQLYAGMTVEQIAVSVTVVVPPTTPGGSSSTLTDRKSFQVSKPTGFGNKGVVSPKYEPGYGYFETITFLNPQTVSFQGCTLNEGAATIAPSPPGSSVPPSGSCTGYFNNPFFYDRIFHTAQTGVSILQCVLPTFYNKPGDACSRPDRIGLDIRASKRKPPFGAPGTATLHIPQTLVSLYNSQTLQFMRVHQRYEINAQGFILVQKHGASNH